MEKREDFKRVVEGINQLEQQLLSIVEDGKVNDKYAAEAEEEVERYFSRCEQALAARKEGLLRELAQKLTAQSMSSSPLLSSPLLLSFVYPLHKKGRQWWMHKKRWTWPSRQGRRCWKQAHTCTGLISNQLNMHGKYDHPPFFPSSLSLFSFLMISSSSSPSYNRRLILHTLNSSFECREPPTWQCLKPQWEGWSWTSPLHSLISSKHLAQVYHLQFTFSKWSQMINIVPSSQLCCCWMTSKILILRRPWQLMPQCSPPRERQWQQRTKLRR